MVNLDMLATVIFISRVWSPDKNTIVVLEVKYDLACCAYSESVAQWIELWGQSEHEVSVGWVGVTHYTFSAEQQERVLSSSVANWTMNGLNWTIATSLNSCVGKVNTSTSKGVTLCLIIILLVFTCPSYLVKNQWNGMVEWLWPQSSTQTPLK